MARRSRFSVRRPSTLLWVIAGAALMAACSLDFDGFNYPDEVVTSNAASNSSSSGNGGMGGTIFASSSSSSGAGGDAGAGGEAGAGGMGGMGGCSNANRCPDGAECQQATCNNNMCGLEDAPLGDPCAQGGNICDGMGTCVTCQADPTPAPGGTCPAACASCNDTNNDNTLDECVMDCTGGNCPANVTCPADFSCVVNCSDNFCSGVTINCPSGQDCTVNCNGELGNTAACAGSTMNCDQSSTCNLNCTNQGCNNSSTMLCGAGKCTGVCDNQAGGTLVCGTSCWCDVDSDCIQQ